MFFERGMLDQTGSAKMPLAIGYLFNDFLAIFTDIKAQINTEKFCK